MDKSPSPYKQQASMSRSISDKDGFRSLTDALLRSPAAHGAPSFSAAPQTAAPQGSASPSADELTVKDAMLRSSLSHSPSTATMTPASASRSHASHGRTGASAGVPVRSAVPRGVSPQASVSRSWASSVSRSSASKGSLGGAADAMLRSPVPRSVSSPILPVSSSSISRTKASQSELNATADSLLRPPASRSVSTPAAPLPSTSVTRSSTSQSGLGAKAEAMLRSPMPPILSSWAASASGSPPSYRSQRSATAAGPEKPAAGRPRPPILGSAPAGVPVRSGMKPVGSPMPSISAAESKRRVRQMQSVVAKASARAPVRDTKGLFKVICSTDVLFIIDTTGSMQSYIDAAKDQVRSIMAEIQRAFLGECIVRMAVVGYKDHEDTPNVEFLDFTPHVSDVHTFLDSLTAIGGGDIPEDVLGGLQQALSASWQQQTRCILHIADAPGHSRALHDFHESLDDMYYKPGSEPHGLTYEPVIQRLVKLGINYTFLNISPSTDRMMMAFSRVYGAAGADCQLLPANKYYDKTSAWGSGLGSSGIPASKRNDDDSPKLLFQELRMGVDTSRLQSLVLKSVTDSVTRTSSRHSMALGRTTLGLGAAGRSSKGSKGAGLRSMLSAVFEHEEEETVPVRLETDPPKWDSSGWLDQKWDLEGYCPEVLVYSDSTLGDMMASDDNIKLSFAQLTVHARSTPFGQGAQRVASYARIAASASRYVVKSFTSGGKGLEHLVEDMRVQALCKAFALEFNGLVRPEQSIDFVVTACLQSKADVAAGRGTGCLSLEPYLAGDYVKYNSNALYVKEDSPGDLINRVAQAFTHFTFERSWGHFMVVDLQGVGNLLTDPVIHTVDPERFKLSGLNWSVEGFKCFFALHECNEVCRQLGLVSNRDMAAAGDWRFRQEWPAMEPTTCCSNKLCQSIIRLARAKTSPKFPGCRWCNACWPQLEASSDRWICAAPGTHHEFDVCRFFYASQGRLPPRKCPEHIEKDTTASSAAAVGGGLWSHMKTESKKKSILGSEF